jgi:hypothetical protein
LINNTDTKESRRSEFRILARKPDEKRPPRIPRLRKKNNIKMDVK